MALKLATCGLDSADRLRGFAWCSVRCLQNSSAPTTHHALRSPRSAPARATSAWELQALRRAMGVVTNKRVDLDQLPDLGGMILSFISSPWKPVVLKGPTTRSAASSGSKYLCLEIWYVLYGQNSFFDPPLTPTSQLRRLLCVFDLWALLAACKCTMNAGSLALRGPLLRKVAVNISEALRLSQPPSSLPGLGTRLVAIACASDHLSDSPGQMAAFQRSRSQRALAAMGAGNEIGRSVHDSISALVELRISANQKMASLIRRRQATTPGCLHRSEEAHRQISQPIGLSWTTEPESRLWRDLSSSRVQFTSYGHILPGKDGEDVGPHIYDERRFTGVAIMRLYEYGIVEAVFWMTGAAEARRCRHSRGSASSPTTRFIVSAGQKAETQCSRLSNSLVFGVFLSVVVGGGEIGRSMQGIVGALAELRELAYHEKLNGLESRLWGNLSPFRVQFTSYAQFLSGSDGGGDCAAFEAILLAASCLGGK
ncbi:hypothetical protein CVT26_002424 [Gymnopilus dilepis]|uniref:Uncharacterized protein n=1 Tax=Gymnopilus dilepis TaxID=231916 RepID=A0A409X510_9AGAR|nr:hypothetical protein CVT26_002424 [Gymnopilus dilepis]